MTTYVLRRLVLMVPVEFLVTIGLFMLIYLTPGDPALIILGEDRSPQAIAQLHEELGLDKTLYVQYFFGIVLIFVLSVSARLFPFGGYVPFFQDPWESLRHVALPAIALGTAGTAINMRFTRSSMIEVLGLDYIRTARAKGASWRRVVFIRALQNPLIPVCTIVCLQLGGIIEGAVVTETVFTWAVGGRLGVESI